jgi:alanine racemase
MDTVAYTIEDIALAVKGELILSTSKRSEIKNILIDSRKLLFAVNTVFFAIVTKRNNGHNYIDDLYKKGVRSFIVSEVPENLKEYKNCNIIKVTDTLIALQLLSAVHRKKFDIPVIALTGSNGKTIVKEWLFQLLCESKNIVRSPKSYNSQIGVPLSVWQMAPEHDLAIFEAGISETDEMDKLQAIIQPTIGIFTNIGTAHAENFMNANQKIGEKLKLFTKVETLIYCSDYHEINERIFSSGLNKNIKLFNWSRKQESNVLIREIVKNTRRTHIIAVFENKEIDITIPFVDDASIENSIHCWVTMLYLGIDNEYIKKRIIQITSVAMRLEMKEGINNCSIINDSYSSDLNSLNIALDFLNQQKQHSKRTVILSDILQSGRVDDELYQEISSMLLHKNVDRIIGVGKYISKNADKFNIEKKFYPTTLDFLNNVNTSDFYNESILLKGARLFEFEKISRLLQQKAHETVLEINLNAMVNNLNHYRSLVNPSVKIMAMVKAFSYGSGSFEIANLLQFHRVDYLAVAYADEGVELRKAGITLPIMIMNPEESSFDAIIQYQLEPELYSFRIINRFCEALNTHYEDKQETFPVHLKLDTGMHRLGFEKNDLKELISFLKEQKHVHINSVFSHLAACEDPAHDDFTNNQIKIFGEMGKKICSSFDYPILMHILNSAGISRFPEAQFDMVRLGIGLYGITAGKEEQKLLQNVGVLKSIISQVKKIPKGDSIGYGRRKVAEKNMKIGIVPIGYADGLNRKLGNNKGFMLVGGKKVPITGSVCMDMCMLDITDIEAREGDEVIIFNDELTVYNMAETLETIPYEILTGVSRRVKRVYFYE